MPLLPLAKKQRGMIGVGRVHHSIQAQLHSRGMQTIAATQGESGEMSYAPSTSSCNRSVSAGAFRAQVVKEVAISTRRTGNHICRPDVCHKGQIGKKGFCRMYFWHWTRLRDEKKGDRAKMTHSLALQPRWNGPPLGG